MSHSSELGQHIGVWQAPRFPVRCAWTSSIQQKRRMSHRDICSLIPGVIWFQSWSKATARNVTYPSRHCHLLFEEHRIWLSLQRFAVITKLLNNVGKLIISLIWSPPFTMKQSIPAPYATSAPVLFYSMSGTLKKIIRPLYYIIPKPANSVHPQTSVSHELFIASFSGNGHLLKSRKLLFFVDLYDTLSCTSGR